MCPSRVKTTPSPGPAPLQGGQNKGACLTSVHPLTQTPRVPPGRQSEGLLNECEHHTHTHSRQNREYSQPPNAAPGPWGSPASSHESTAQGQSLCILGRKHNEGEVGGRRGREQFLLFPHPQHPTHQQVLSSSATLILQPALSSRSPTPTASSLPPAATSIHLPPKAIALAGQVTLQLTETSEGHLTETGLATHSSFISWVLPCHLPGEAWSSWQKKEWTPTQTAPG